VPKSACIAEILTKVALGYYVHCIQVRKLAVRW